MRDDLVQTIIENEESVIPFIIFGGGAVVAIIAIIFGAIKRIAMNSEREKSRREIAAYIAEGSMSPDDGIRLLKATPADKDLNHT